MPKPRALALFCCLAALPLIGCANGVGPQSQAYPPPPPLAAAVDGTRIYAAGAGAPAAILMMLPGPADVLTADPAMWPGQGFDVVTPSPSEMLRLAADRQAAFERLIAPVRAMADAPVWLVGPNPAIEAAIAGNPTDGHAAGMVVTSVASNAGTCSETMTYSYPGNGAAPKVTVSKSGDACPAGTPFGAVRDPAVVPAVPMQRNAPRLIEASAPAAGGPSSSRQAAVQHVPDLIKASPSS